VNRARHDSASRAAAAAAAGTTALAAHPLHAWDDALASRLRGAGLAAPALLWLGSLRPLWFLGGQALRLADPFYGALRDDDHLRRLSGLLEDPERCRRFLDRLAAPADPEAAP